jgi:hypothetical protein
MFAREDPGTGAGVAAKNRRDGMKTMYVHDRMTNAPADIRVGEHVEVIRRNGPGDGKSMGYATVSSVDPLTFRFEAWPTGFGHNVGTRPA